MITNRFESSCLTKVLISKLTSHLKSCALDWVMFFCDVAKQQMIVAIDGQMKPHMKPAFLEASSQSITGWKPQQNSTKETMNE